MLHRTVSSLIASVWLLSLPVGADTAVVTVNPGTFEMIEGQTQTLTAVTKDIVGAVLEGRTVTWSSSDPSVADVDASGKVTAKVPGSASIRATDPAQNSSGQAAEALPSAVTNPTAEVAVWPVMTRPHPFCRADMATR